MNNITQIITQQENIENTDNNILEIFTTDTGYRLGSNTGVPFLQNSAEQALGTGFIEELIRISNQFQTILHNSNPDDALRYFFYLREPKF